MTQHHGGGGAERCAAPQGRRAPPRGRGGVTEMMMLSVDEDKEDKRASCCWCLEPPPRRTVRVHPPRRTVRVQQHVISSEMRSKKSHVCFEITSNSQHNPAKRPPPNLPPPWKKLARDIPVNHDPERGGCSNVGQRKATLQLITCAKRTRARPLINATHLRHEHTTLIKLNSGLHMALATARGYPKEKERN